MPDRAELAASDSQVSSLARTILERPRYADYRASPYDLQEIIRTKWHELLDWLLDLRETDPGAYWSLTVLLSAACALIIAHVVWTLRATLTAPSSAPPSAARDAELDFAREAQELAQRGEPLEAAHQLLLACLRILAQRRWIPLQPADGNHTVRQRLASCPLPELLREQLIGLIAETERAWFAAPGKRASHQRTSEPDGANHPGATARAAETAGPELYRRWAVAHTELLRMAQP